VKPWVPLKSPGINKIFVNFMGLKNRHGIKFLTPRVWSRAVADHVQTDLFSEKLIFKKGCKKKEGAF
jgi:hypothetical protein